MLPEPALTAVPAHDIGTLARALAHHGFATVGDVRSREDVLALAEWLGTIVPHRDSDGDGITTITSLGQPTSDRSGYAGFGTGALLPHTERSSVPEPPVLQIMVCQQPAETGGECTVVDGAALYTELATAHPEALRALATPRSAFFGGAAGYLGAVFQRADNHAITVRLRLDELARFSPEVTRWLPALREAIDRHTTAFSLPAGQGYVLHNRRWLHGRLAFTGRRAMYRVHVNPSPRWGIPAEFVPGCSHASVPAAASPATGL